MRLARVLSASASGGAASWSSCSPDSESRQTSSFLRLRSNPACNIEDAPPLSSLLGDSRSVSPEGALLHGSPKRNLPTPAAWKPLRHNPPPLDPHRSPDSWHVL